MASIAAGALGLLLLAAISLLLGACNDNVAAPTQTLATTASSALPTTSTEPAEPNSFFREPGTPVGELSSFVGHTTIESTADNITRRVVTVGVFVSNADGCSTTTETPGSVLTTTVIATADNVWLNRGLGATPGDPADQEIVSVTGVCLANPEFWRDFRTLPSLIDGEPDVLNGIKVLKVPFTDQVPALLGFGDDTGGVRFGDSTAWFADPRAGWPIST